MRSPPVPPPPPTIWTLLDDREEVKFEEDCIGPSCGPDGPTMGPPGTPDTTAAVVEADGAVVFM